MDANDSAEQEQMRRTQQTIDTLNQAHDKIDQFLQTETPDSDNIYSTDAIVTADTGFANEANMQYLFYL